MVLPQGERPRRHGTRALPASCYPLLFARVFFGTHESLARARPQTIHMEAHSDEEREKAQQEVAVRPQSIKMALPAPGDAGEAGLARCASEPLAHARTLCAVCRVELAAASGAP